MGKKKGSGYERDIAKEFSKWWTIEDMEKALWRSDMVRGGAIEFPGDICANLRQGMDFPFIIECKNNSSWQWKSLTLPKEEKKNYFYQWWDKLQREIEEKDYPRQDEEMWPIMCFTKNYEKHYIATNKEVWDKFPKLKEKIYLHCSREDEEDLFIFRRDYLFELYSREEVEEVRYG